MKPSRDQKMVMVTDAISTLLGAIASNNEELALEKGVTLACIVGISLVEISDAAVRAADALEKLAADQAEPDLIG